jgi:hypothetical protein
MPQLRPPKTGLERFVLTTAWSICINRHLLDAEGLLVTGQTEYCSVMWVSVPSYDYPELFSVAHEHYVLNCHIRNTSICCSLSFTGFRCQKLLPSGCHLRSCHCATYPLFLYSLYLSNPFLASLSTCLAPAFACFSVPYLFSLCFLPYLFFPVQPL